MVSGYNLHQRATLSREGQLIYERLRCSLRVRSDALIAIDASYGERQPDTLYDGFFSRHVPLHHSDVVEIGAERWRVIAVYAQPAYIPYQRATLRLEPKLDVFGLVTIDGAPATIDGSPMRIQA